MTKEVRYELLSLNGSGRADTLRILFLLAGQDFEDVRLKVTEWRAFKAKASLPPDVRLPLLRIKGHCVVAGTVEIGRTLARRFGFYAESTIEQREIEAIVGCVQALHTALSPVIRATLSRDSARRMRQWADFRADLLQPVLDHWQRRLGPCRFFAADRLTWADICVAEMLSRFVRLFEPDLLRDRPALDRHRVQLEQRPELAGWLASRTRNLF